MQVATAPNVIRDKLDLMGLEKALHNALKLKRPHRQEQQTESVSAGRVPYLNPRPQAAKLIRLGDVGPYLGISQNLVTRFVLAGAIKTMTNPLDRRLKLVSTRELDEFKQQLEEMQSARDMARSEQ